MGLNASKIKGNGGGERVEQPNIEPGTYPARLVQLIDLGVQPQRPFKGQDKPPVQEIMLTYELVDTFMIDKEGNEVEDKPRWVSETLPFYGLFADKAKSTQRYNAFDPSGDFDGDFSKAVGMPINVTIINNAVGDKIYDNIATISAMRARDAANCPALVNPSKVFDLDDPDMEVFNTLPAWIQDKIKGNLKYESSTLQKLLGNNKQKPPAKVDKQKKEAIQEDIGDQSENPY